MTVALRVEKTINDVTPENMSVTVPQVHMPQVMRLKSERVSCSRYSFPSLANPIENIGALSILSRMRRAGTWYGILVQQDFLDGEEAVFYFVVIEKSPDQFRCL